MGCTVLTPDACPACYIVAPGGYLAVHQKMLMYSYRSFDLSTYITKVTVVRMAELSEIGGDDPHSTHFTHVTHVTHVTHFTISWLDQVYVTSSIT